MQHEKQWLLLGCALANKHLAARIMAELEPGAFAAGHARSLFTAMHSGREGVRVQLSMLLGFNITRDARLCDAVLDAVQLDSQQAQQRQLAGEVDAAARLLAPEQFREWLAQRVGEFIPEREEGAKESIAGHVMDGEEVA